MTKAEIRRIERSSIRSFLTDHQQYLCGRVLDYGCGIVGKCIKEQPYRDLVSGEYVPFDVGYAEPAGRFDAILCTQVLQYILEPAALLAEFRARTQYLVVTYPTHWEEVEHTDLWRFTKAGMNSLLSRAGFDVLVHVSRWSLPFQDFSLAGGYGVVARVRSTHHA